MVTHSGDMPLQADCEPGDADAHAGQSGHTQNANIPGQLLLGGGGKRSQLPASRCYSADGIATACAAR
jgi:hypothetical protein